MEILQLSPLPVRVDSHMFELTFRLTLIEFDIFFRSKNCGELRTKCEECEQRDCSLKCAGPGLRRTIRQEEINMQALKLMALVTLCAAMPTNAALAANIDAEIDKWYLQPCQRLMSTLTTLYFSNEEGAAASDLDQITKDGLAVNHENNKQAKEALRVLTRNAPWEERKDIYMNTLINTCAKSVFETFD